jgi:DNA-binding NarL/FixJ family response regulator
MDEVTCMLVDDDTLVRAGLSALLNTLPGINCISEASDGREALAMLENPPHPDVVLMDIAMPELNGIDATRQIRREHPGVPVLMLSTYTAETQVIRSLRAGAVGFVAKTASVGELEAAIRTAARGERFLGTDVTRVDIQEAPVQSSLERLTSRQREILQLIAEGYTSREIAQKLEVARKTVETHRAQLMQRLGIRGVAGLVRYAIEMGLIEPDS